MHDNQDTGGQGQGAAGLTPTQQQEYGQTIDKIKTIRRTYERLRGDGLTPAKAKAKALSQTGNSHSSWLGKIAVQLAKDGDLSRNAIQILESHLPTGASAPDRWT